MLRYCAKYIKQFETLARILATNLIHALDAALIRLVNIIWYSYYGVNFCPIHDAGKTSPHLLDANNEVYLKALQVSVKDFSRRDLNEVKRSLFDSAFS